MQAFERERALAAEALERARHEMTLAVVFSGNKADPGRVLRETVNTRSWKSYEQVAEDLAQTLRDLGFKSVITLAEGINLLDELRREKVDLVWVNSGGVQGIDPVSHLPALLEMAGLPYVGHNPANATVLDNKHIFKWGLAAKGIPTSPFLVWNGVRKRFPGLEHPKFHRNFGDYEGPFIVKPVNGRGSVMVEYAEKASDLADAVDMIADKCRNAAMIEKYLGGAEYTVAAMGPLINRAGKISIHDDPSTFSFNQRNLDPDEKIFTSMDVKPITGARFRTIDPAEEPSVTDQLGAIGRAIYRSFNLETLVRIDARADENGEIFVLEANPKPDLKKPQDGKTNLVCGGLGFLDLTYEDLVLSLITSRLLDAELGVL